VQEGPIRLELDTGARNTPPPDELKAAQLKARVLDAFAKVDAKTPETRERRILKVVAARS
jgi:hypothetical protein